jgi:hypothetical protein
MKPIRTLSLILVLCGGTFGAEPQGGTGPGARVAPARPAPQAPQATGMSLKEVREAFAKADADRSGSLSVDEAAFGGLDAAGFTAGDADGDAKLNLDEYVVASESRVAKLSGGAASDLTAESTRVQALRRAQKAEAQKTRREAAGAPAIGAGTAPPAAADPAGAAGATPGPAAARRALAPAAPAAPGAAGAETDDPRTLQEIRSSIVRRLRNGEISEEKARVELEAVDRRIANATKGAATAAPEVSGAPAGAAQADKKIDLRSVEASLNKRIRNSDLEGDQAVATYENTLRRIENARGATPPPAAAPRQPADPAVPQAAGTEPPPAAPHAQGFRG